MLNRHALIYCVAILVLLAIDGNAQERAVQDRIVLGSTTLTLEMPQNAVVSSIAREYDITPSSTDSALWMIRERASRNVVGSLRFDGNGKLVYINKHWTVGSNNYTGLEVSKAIFGVVAGFEKEHRTSCVIGTQQEQSPGPVKEDREVFFVCGRKTLSIDIENYEGVESTEVYEVLAVPNLRARSRH